MDRMELARWREQALIWMTSLALAFAGLKLAQRAAPRPFAAARAQLSIEWRNLGWTAEDLRQGRTRVLTGPSGLSLDSLRRSLDEESGRAEASLGSRIVARREDLLERANRGLR